MERVVRSLMLFDDFGHHDEVVGRVRRVGEGVFAVEAGLRHILAEDIEDRVCVGGRLDGGDIEVCDEFVEVSWEETWSYGGGESHVVQIRLEDLADPEGFRARKEAEMAEREVHDRKAALARAQASAEYFRAQAQALAAIDSGE